MRRLMAAGALAAVALLVTGCGGDDPKSTSTVRLGQIRSAIAAVEAQAGGPQTYSEVNATESEVNVFVVKDGQDFAYVVTGGSIEPPPASEAYTGPTFTAEQVAFVPGVLDVIEENLPGSKVVAFSITPKAAGGVDYIATVRATGGELRVLLDANGAVLSVG